MHAVLVRQVWERAGGRCEYCHIPQELDEATFEIDHITPRKHGGINDRFRVALREALIHEGLFPPR